MSSKTYIAANLLSNEETAKVGVKNKRLLAGKDNDYLYKVLNRLTYTLNAIALGDKLCSLAFAVHYLSVVFHTCFL